MYPWERVPEIRSTKQHTLMKQRPVLAPQICTGPKTHPAVQPSPSPVAPIGETPCAGTTLIAQIITYSLSLLLRWLESGASVYGNIPDGLALSVHHAKGCVRYLSAVTAWVSLLEPKFAFAAENKVFDSPKATSLL